METSETRSKLANAIRTLQASGDTASIDGLVSAYKRKYQSQNNTPNEPQSFAVPTTQQDKQANYDNAVKNAQKAELEARANTGALNIAANTVKNIGSTLASSEIGLGKTIAKTFGNQSTSYADTIGKLNQTQAQLLGMIKSYEKEGRDATNLKRVYNQNINQLKEAGANLNEEANLPTTGQVVGQLGGTALDLLTAGTYGRATAGMNTGKIASDTISNVAKSTVASGLPELSKISEQKASGLFTKKGALNVAKGAGIGYGYDVAQGLQGARGEDRTGGKAFIPGLGTAIGMGIPAISEGVQAVKNLSKGETSANIMQRVARIPKQKQAKFKNMTGESVGEFLNNRGIYGSEDDIVNQLTNRFKQSKDEVDKALSTLQGTYKFKPVETALDDLVAREARISTPGAVSKDFARINQLAKKSKNGLTMAEINEAKRLYERNVKLDFIRSQNTEGVARSNNIDEAIRQWQFKQADRLGFKNLKALNKETQASRQLADDLAREVTGKAGNNAISITDWILLAGGDLKSIAGLGVKKVAESGKYRSALAKTLSRGLEKKSIPKAEFGGVTGLPARIKGIDYNPTIELPPVRKAQPIVDEAMSPQIMRSSSRPDILRLPAPTSEAQGVPIYLPKNISKTNVGLNEVENASLNQTKFNKTGDAFTRNLNTGEIKYFPKSSKQVNLPQQEKILSKSYTKTLPQNKSIIKKVVENYKNTPNKQGGFISTTPYKETGNLTTKILKDLEGKTTVSKQYILDATNRGELKQVERDLIRDILERETPKIEGVSPDLLQEAKKYKSAEEFVNSNKFYRGESNQSPTRTTTSLEFGGGKYITKNPEYAKNYGKIQEKFLSPDVNIIDAESPINPKVLSIIQSKLEPINTVDSLLKRNSNPTFREVWKRATELGQDEKIFNDALKQAGYDGISFRAGNFLGSQKFPSISLWNENKLISKEELKSIWNKAKGSDTINVSDFAKKVKAELLPLKVKDTVMSQKEAVSKLKQAGYTLEQDMSGEANITDKNGDWVDYNDLPSETQKLVDGAIGNAQSYSELGKPKYESITLPEDLRGNVKNYKENIYESPIKTSAGGTHFSGQSQNYFGHTRIEDMADNKTRRVIEVQSDLYQKGRLEQEKFIMENKANTGISKKQGFDNDYIKFTTENNIYPKDVVLSKDGAVKNAERLLSQGYTINDKSFLMAMLKDAKDLLKDLPNSNVAKNKVAVLSQAVEEVEKKKIDIQSMSKLQQYNDPTAHFRMIREEIKKAAQDGKTKLQFPTGETAMRIEGLDALSQKNWTILSDKSQLTPTNVKVGLEVSGNPNATDAQKWIITDVLGDGKFKAVPKSTADMYKFENGKFVGDVFDNTGKKSLGELPEHNKETFDISGKVDTNNPIYKFYEKEVSKYLNKFGGKRVVDDNGVSWIELPITEAQGKAPVEAFGKVRLNPLLVGAGILGTGVVGAKIMSDKKKANLPKRK